MKNCYKLTYYRGYIRNLKKLCAELNIAMEGPAKEVEKRVILEGYTKWEDNVVDHLFGSFAFVILDTADGKQIAVRDQLGGQPLYYTLIQDELYCSGSIKELMEKPGFEKRLNHAALQRYLRFSYPTGVETLFQNVKKLMPGCILKWSGTREPPAITRYFRPRFSIDERLSMEECSERIHKTFQEILEEETPSQALALLSGGVDSAYLLAMTGAETAYTISYSEADFDESDLAEKTARYLGKAFRKITVTPQEYFGMIPEVMGNLEQPLGDASAVTIAIACKNMAEQGGVCYSGEGADEFFGGYYSYGRVHNQHTATGYLGCTVIMDDRELRALLRQYDETQTRIALVEEMDAWVGTDKNLARMLLTDIALWLEGDIFLIAAKMSEAYPVALRTPLSDFRMFQTAATIPDWYKVCGGRYKVVFRKAANKVLPDSIAYRKKVGFAVPVRKWLGDVRFRWEIECVLFGEASALFFHQAYLRKLWRKYLGGCSRLWRKLYAVYAFLVWYHQYFESGE